MADDQANNLLLPAKPEQLTFDVLYDALPDVSLRDQPDGMERAIVSLGKRMRTVPIRHDLDNGLFIEVIANEAIGMATIWDYDIVIYLIGQLMQRAQAGQLAEVPAVTVSPHALLQAIGRPTGGEDYVRLRQAIKRLQTTLVETNLWVGRKRAKTIRFPFIAGFEENDPGEASSGGMTFVLPRWLVASVRARNVLSIHRGYFGLDGGIERYLYRVSRKLAGRQPEGARISLRNLHERSGSPMRLADFAKGVRSAVERGNIPEYRLSLYRNADGEEVLRIEPDTLSQLPSLWATPRFL